MLVAVIISIIVLIIIGGPIFMFIAGTVKEKMDEEHGNTEKYGWMIAILIAGVLCFAFYKACQVPDRAIEYRHSDNI